MTSSELNDYYLANSTPRQPQTGSRLRIWNSADAESTYREMCGEFLQSVLKISENDCVEAVKILRIAVTKFNFGSATNITSLSLWETIATKLKPLVLDPNHPNRSEIEKFFNQTNFDE